MEIKSIICPIDGSELTEKVVDAGAYLARVTGAKLILLNVVEKWYRSEPLVTDSPEWKKIHEEWLNDGRQILEREAIRLKEFGVKHIETVLSDGDAAYEIVALANERNADLVIMATKHYSPMGKFFLGSITDRVSKKSPCPILWVFE